MNKYQCTISKLPIHCGDGYNWGGDIIITINIRESDFTMPLSINLGSDEKRYGYKMEFARIIQAALHNYHETPDKER